MQGTRRENFAIINGFLRTVEDAGPYKGAYKRVVEVADPYKRHFFPLSVIARAFMPVAIPSILLPHPIPPSVREVPRRGGGSVPPPKEVHSPSLLRRQPPL